MNLYLQNIVENFNQNNLPDDWLGIDFEKFSKGKTLFDYQQKASENALKASYFEEYMNLPTPTTEGTNENSPSYTGYGIDIAETLSNLTGKWIKKIRENEVVFKDDSVIDTKDLDYKLIKPLIWWE